MGWLGEWLGWGLDGEIGAIGATDPAAADALRAALQGLPYDPIAWKRGRDALTQDGVVAYNATVLSLPYAEHGQRDAAADTPAGMTSIGSYDEAKSRLLPWNNLAISFDERLRELRADWPGIRQNLVAAGAVAAGLYVFHRLTR
jgi:hypothetical protein